MTLQSAIFTLAVSFMGLKGPVWTFFSAHSRPMLSSWYDSSYPSRCLYLATKYSHNSYDRYVLSFYQTHQVFR